MDDERKIQLQHLFDTRKLQVDVQRELRKSIDQAILTLSGAALGLSLTVIKDVAKATPRFEYMLVTSWCCFGVSIFATLTAMWLTSVSVKKSESITLLHYNALLRNISTDAVNLDKRRQEIRRFGRWSDWAQTGAAFTFGGGIIATGVFVFQNLP